MRTFEMKKTQRFWSIERDKKKITVRYGKIGGKPTARTSEAREPTLAIYRYHSQIDEKVRAGYKETTADDVAPLDATGLALEGALIDNPDDLAAHMAFADWLSEQGDVRHQARGEFVRLQLQLENESIPDAQRKKLKKREKELLAANERRWMGWRLYDVLFDGGGGFRSYALRKPDEARGYRRGWLDRLVLPMVTAEVARILTASPGSRLLRELDLEGLFNLRLSRAISDVGALANVRVLRVGDATEDESIAPLISRFPKLEVLRLEGADRELGDTFSLETLGALVELHVEAAADYDVQALAKNPSLGRLRRLALLPNWTEREHGPHVTVEDVRALANSKHLKGLTSLAIHRTDAGDEGVGAIIVSGLLSRLSELDLSNGCITDRGAEALARAKGFANLKSLALTNNRLTQAGISALRRPGLNLEAGDQQVEGPGGYTDEYLYDDWEGEWDDFDEDWDDEWE
jgi:uncharacterized protein (TIGR02996 family)